MAENQRHPQTDDPLIQVKRQVIPPRHADHPSGSSVDKEWHLGIFQALQRPEQDDLDTLDNDAQSGKTDNQVELGQQAKIR
ncbi:hypothetical protein D3C71_1418710 [compost metagenome]